MSFSHNLVEVLGLHRGKSGKAEVIKNQEIRFEEFLDFLFPGVIGPGGMKAAEHLHRFDKKHIISPACSVGRPACPVGRPHDQGPEPDGFSLPPQRHR